ncbi:agamous-like MADS-box protein AGL62 [Trifolium pratense]|uniref:agamous-like MADS-box protein AGL62 n=1 Tax=Trifolium pratense TaxID=57577 RepID=UPI001E691256|nr:agamous-like MADS-box protein AGL62 [Trifolium pratense]
MAFEGNNAAKKENTRKRKIDEIKKADFSKRKLGLFNKVTELSILCKAKTALIIRSSNNELDACGYPDCDAVVQQFLAGKVITEDYDKKKKEEVVEIQRLEYETIVDKLMELKEEEKNLEAINDEAEKSGYGIPDWWNGSIDDMSLESLQEFKNSLETLKLNLRLNLDAKKLM